MNKMRLFVALLAVGCAAAPQVADAQSIDVMGTRAAGMAGAFVGVADDASAAYWNPAGLAAGSYFSLVLDGGSERAAPEQLVARPEAIGLLSWRHDSGAGADVLPPPAVGCDSLRDPRSCRRVRCQPESSGSGPRASRFARDAPRRRNAGAVGAPQRGRRGDTQTGSRNRGLGTARIRVGRKKRWTRRTFGAA